jgi:hypothetical protein
MKKILLAIIALSGAMASFGQTDTTGTEKTDTIKVGGMIILKKHGENDQKDKDNDNDVVISNHHHHRSQSNVKTNWGIVDLGFANYSDKTDYSSQGAQEIAPGFNKDGLKLRTGKSVNVNIWFFMQQVNMVKHILNLKYGLGLELNNYHYDDERVRFSKNPTLITLDQTLEGSKKNKLAADYITLPLMLNLNFTPDRHWNFGFSGGVSAGYLYSSRQKIKADDNNKTKLHDDFNLNPWKISYVGEVFLGPIRLYGSIATKSMWDKGLDQTPYNVGIRLSSE